MKFARLRDIHTVNYSPALQHDQAITGMVLSLDATKIITASGSNTLIIWDYLSGIAQERVDSLYSIQLLAPHADSRYAYIATTDGSVGLFDIQDHKVSNITRLADGPIRLLTTSQHNACIVVGHEDGTITVMDMATLSIVNHIIGYTVSSLDCNSSISHPREPYIFTENADRTISQINIHTGESQILDMQTSSTIVSLSVNRNGTQIASLSRRGHLQIWDLTSGKLHFEHHLKGTGFRKVLYSFDSAFILIGATDLTILSSTTGEIITSMPGFQANGPWQYHHSNHCLTISSGLFPSTFSIPDVKALAPSSIQSTPMRYLAYSDDGAFIAGVGSDQQIRIWQFNTTYQLNQVVLAHSQGTRKVYFAHDNQWLITSGYLSPKEMEISIWNLSTGKLMAKRSETMGYVAVGPDAMAVAILKSAPQININALPSMENIQIVEITMPSSPDSTAWMDGTSTALEMSRSGAFVLIARRDSLRDIVQILCINLIEGKLLWELHLDIDYGDIISLSIDRKDQLFAFGRHSEIGVGDLLSGTLLWTIRDTDLSSVVLWGPTFNILFTYYDDILIAALGNSIILFDCLAGDLIYQHHDDSYSVGSIAANTRRPEIAYGHLSGSISVMEISR